MDAEFCLIHGYEYMYQREISDPFRYCRRCEDKEKPMTIHSTHTYNTDMQGELVLSGTCFDDGLQWEVSVTVVCTYPGCPAQLCGPPENCYPAEGPEFEFQDFVLFVGKVTILRSTSWSKAEALFGKIIWNHLYNDAVIDAEENPDD